MGIDRNNFPKLKKNLIKKILENFYILEMIMSLIITQKILII